jgi:hypothetical protein
MPGPPLEVNASAGRVGDSLMFTLAKGLNDRIRVNAAPSRTATVTPLGGALRNWTVANDGTQGAGADVASGASQTVVAADGAREFVLVSAADSVTVRVVIS